MKKYPRLAIMRQGFNSNAFQMFDQVPQLRENQPGAGELQALRLPGNAEDDGGPDEAGRRARHDGRRTISCMLSWERAARMPKASW